MVMPCGAKGFNHLEDAVARLGIDADGGLVHEHQARMVDEAGSHVEASLHAAGECAGKVVGAVFKRGPVEAPGRRRRRALAGKAVVAAEGAQIFLGGQARIDGELLRNPAQRRARSERAGRRAENCDAAGVGNDSAGNGADERALAGAVRAEQAQAFAGGERKRYTVHGGVWPKRLTSETIMSGAGLRSAADETAEVGLVVMLAVTESPCALRESDLGSRILAGKLRPSGVCSAHEENSTLQSTLCQL